MAKTMLPLLLVASLATLTSPTIIHTVAGQLEYHESWGYANVRPNAHMFWWLYYTQPEVAARTNRPLYMWLQGGPGSSGTGFGNFDEFGPLDATLKPRNTTWLQRGDLLFVDNPVGTGFSYVTDDSAYTTDVMQISKDLLTLLTKWFRDHPMYQKRPFYIISESYGGKMTAHFASILYPAMKAGKIQCNLKGVGLGDSWISPVDFVNSWGKYLYYLSYLSDTDLGRYEKLAGKCAQLVATEQWTAATQCWDDAEVLVGRLTDGRIMKLASIFLALALLTTAGAADCSATKDDCLAYIEEQSDYSFIPQACKVVECAKTKTPVESCSSVLSLPDAAGEDEVFQLIHCARGVDAESKAQEASETVATCMEKLKVCTEEVSGK